MPRARQFIAPDEHVCESALTRIWPGQRVALGRDDHVRDAVLADGEVVLDAEPLDELAHALGVVRGLHRRRRHDVVVEQHQLVGVGDTQDVGPGVVELHGHVDVDHHDVAGRDLLLLGVIRQDLLDRVHAHRFAPSKWSVTGG